MANRYWVLGTGTWDGTSTTNWSTSSGGPGGASVPTAADNVFFDVNSNVGTTAFTVTMATTPRVCNDFTASGLDGVMTLAGSAIGLTVSGSLTFQATNFTRTYTGTTTFNATTTGKTVTTNGVAFGAGVTFDGVGGAWTLGSAFSCGTNTLTITNGTFDTSSSGNYAVTAGSFTSSANANAQVINFNASTVTAAITFNGTNLTFNAGTSSIVMNSVGGISISGPTSITFYNVTMSYTYGSPITTTIDLTFNNLTKTATTGNYYGISFSSGRTYTINGTFSVSTGTNVVGTVTSTAPTGCTIYAAAVSLNSGNVFLSFRGINATGPATPWTATRVGDAGFNSGITFSAARNVYWVSGTGGSVAPSATKFGLSSGGAAAIANYPKPQDTLIFDNNSITTTGQTISVPFGSDNYAFGAIDFSGLTQAITFTDSGSNQLTLYGSLTWSNQITWGTPTTNPTVLRTINFLTRGVGNIVITSNGGTIQDAISTSAYSTDEIRFADTFTQTRITGVATAASITHNIGTLNINNQTVSTEAFLSTNSNTRTIAFGTGNIECTGTGTAWTTATTTGLTTTGTQVVNITSTATTPTTITVSTGQLSEANSISFNFTGGTYALSFLALSTHSARNIDFTGYAGTWNGTNIVTVYGNFKLSTGITLSGGAGAMTFGATSGTQQITTNAKTIDFPLTFNGAGGAFQLQDALTMGSTRTTTLTNGTLALQSFKLSTGLFSSSNSNTRTIAFGTGSIDCTGTGTVYTTLTSTGLTCTGSKTVNITSSGSTAITVNPNASFVASLQNINFTGGTYTLTIGNGANINDLNFTGYAGSYTPTVGGTVNVYGNLTISTGMTLGSSTGTMQFFGTGIQAVTTNAKTFDFNITQNQTGSVQLQDAWTIGSTRTYTHYYGTLSLQTYTLTAGLFVSNSGFTRAIAFGTGNITLNCSTTGLIVWDMYASSANFSYTGTPTVNISSALTSASALGFQPSTTYSANTTLNFNFTSGSYFLYAPYGSGVSGTTGYVGAMNFTGFSGTLYLYGYLYISVDLTLSSSMTLSFANSSYYYVMYPLSGATANITSNGKTIPNIFYFFGIDNTSNTKLLDAFTNNSSVVYLSKGKLDLNGKTLTAVNITDSNTGVPFELTFNNGTIVVQGAWTNSIGTLLTTVAGTGAGTISMTSASTKTFAGGSATYNCTLNQGGAGQLTVSGSNTFLDITNTVQPASVLFIAGATNTFTNFSLSGTAGNLITIGSTTAASHTLSKSSGTVSVSYCSISRSTATGGATWNAFTSNGNVDGGNNSGWIFTSAAIYNVYITEAASGVDAITSYAIFYSAVQEFASGIDQIDAAQTFTTSIAETGSGLDQVDASQNFVSSVAETASGLDQDSVASSTFNAYSEEMVSGLDAVSSVAVFETSVNETGSGLDDISALQTFATDVTESASGLDQVDSSQTFATDIAETSSGVDQVDTSAVLNSSASETASGVDSVSSNSEFVSSASETASGVDAVSSKQRFASDVAETAAGIDAVSTKQRFATRIAETASGVDQVDSAQAFRSLIAEAASGVDSDSVAASTFNAFASETSSGVDSIFSNPSFGSVVSETGAGIDASSSKQTFVTAIAETAAGLDTPSVAASTFKAAIAETASGVDSISSNPTFGSSISETASGVDSISSSATFASSIAETASGVDSIYAYQGFGAFISETASGLDAISTAGSIFSAAFTDSASGIDALQPNFTYFITVPEGVNAQDLIYARYLWELIDNTETADWGVINDTQTASWSQIDDTQALNWQNVGNTQTATWSQIDDTESGNWEQI